MEIKILGFIVFSLSCIAAGQRTFLDNEANIRLLRAIKEFGRRVIGTSGESSRSLQEARYQRRVQSRIPNYVPFPCNISASRSKSVPKSVDKLRPGDIDVIGAIGDSLTAGNGVFATSILQVLVENRGVTALGGGQGTWRDYLTIPNIIKEFNPNLIGYSLHDSLTYQEASQFNVAELGAMSRDLPYMAQNLVRRIKYHPEVDVKSHWKLISILIGHNDFCADMCWVMPSPWSILKNHKIELVETLRILKENLPRTLVSLVPPPNLSILAMLREKSPLCVITTDIECPCLLGLRWYAQRDVFREIMYRWQQIDEEIATYPEFQTEDFAVVAQPFATNLTFPIRQDGTTDWRYLSTDCFHLSQVANARAAVAIWKNMLEPVGEKSRNWEEIITLKCPTESRPYIATAANSKPSLNNEIDDVINKIT